MNGESEKPGPMVQAALDIGGKQVDVTPEKDIIHTPSQPLPPAKIIKDGSDGHELGTGTVVKPKAVPPKKPL